MPQGFTQNANVQTSYRTALSPRLPGEAWAGSNNLDQIEGDVVNCTPTQSQLTRLVPQFNNGDLVGIGINGVGVVYQSGADVPTDLASMKAALDASAAVEDSPIAGLTVDITSNTHADLQFPGSSDFVVVPTPLGGGSATFTVETITPASHPENMKAGYGIVYDATTAGNPTKVKVRSPSSMDDRYAGIVYRDGRFPRHQDPDATFGLTPPETVPSGAMFQRWRRGQPVLATNQAVSQGDPVFMVMTGPDAGKFRKDSGATSQASTITFTGGGGGGQADFDVDGLPAIVVADQGSDAANAAAVRDAWNARADLAALATASIDAGAPTVLALAFKDDLAHAFNDASVTVTLTFATPTSAVAATAKPIDGGGTFIADFEAGSAPAEINTP